MTTIRLNQTVLGDPIRDQSVELQSALDAAPNGSELLITEPIRASVILRGRGKTLRTDGAGIIIGAAPLDRSVSEHARQRVNVLCEGEDLTVSAAIAASGGGAVGFRNCLRGRVWQSALGVNSHERELGEAMVIAMGGDYIDVQDSLIVATTEDPEFGGIRIGNANPDQITPNGNVVGNRISRCGHSPIACITAGEIAYNDIDGTGQTHGSGIAVAHDLPNRRWRHVHHNHVRNSPGQGIQADATAGVITRRVICECNDIYGSGLTGIYLARAAQWHVRSNCVRRNGRLTQTDHRGIVVSHGSGNIVISDNDLSDQPGGILVLAAAEGNIDDVEVRGNRVHSTTQFASFGVRGLYGSIALGVVSHGNRWMGMDKDGNSVWVGEGVQDLVMGADECAGKIHWHSQPLGTPGTLAGGQ